MTVPALGALLGRSVRLRLSDLRVGTVTGVYGSPGFERVIGLEVSGRDGRRRFLPWVASAFDDGAVRLQSAFLLVDTGELDAYMRLGARLARDPAELAGLTVATDGRIGRGNDGVSLQLAPGTPVG